MKNFIIGKILHIRYFNQLKLFQSIAIIEKKIPPWNRYKIVNQSFIINIKISFFIRNFFNYQFYPTTCPSTSHISEFIAPSFHVSPWRPVEWMWEDKKSIKDLHKISINICLSFDEISWISIVCSLLTTFLVCGMKFNQCFFWLLFEDFLKIYSRIFLKLKSLWDGLWI